MKRPGFYAIVAIEKISVAPRAVRSAMVGKKTAEPEISDAQKWQKNQEEKEYETLTRRNQRKNRME